MTDAPICPACHGTGFVLVDTGSGVDAARPCDCRRERLGRMRLAAARIPPRYEHCTFASFAPLNDSLAQALALARRVVEGFPGSERGLLFTGPCGVGKTHLAVATLRELVAERGARGIFVEVNQLLRSLQDTFDRRAETAGREVLDPVLAADVLLLDDVGVTRPTPWALETLGLVLNERYNRSALTLLTTNLPPEADGEHESLADRLGARLVSRLAEMCWIVELRGSDFRRTVKAAEFHS
ncbi:MAG: cell division protein ZapE [Acidobacteria bacterium]|nr:MAG: cell division protein ZapE [Acidobacteriota bacterium]